MYKREVSVCERAKRKRGIECGRQQLFQSGERSYLGLEKSREVEHAKEQDLGGEAGTVGAEKVTVF